MRLGLVLLHIARPKIPYRFRGKNRLVKEPSLHDLYKMKLDFEREERNMLILRHPYLTLEQSHNEGGTTKRTKSFLDKIYEYRRQKFQKEITIAERLNHLRVAEAWD